MCVCVWVWVWVCVCVWVGVGVCGWVCGCAACVDAYAETWSGGEKRGYGGCVLVPFSCSIHHHHHHHLHVPRPLHAHARTVAVYAECCALAPSFIPLLSLLFPFLPSPPVLGHTMQVLACGQKLDVCCHTTTPVQTGAVAHCEHVWRELRRGGWLES